MWCRSLTEKELKLNQLKHKQMPPQFLFATLTFDIQIKPVHYSVTQETVLPSQKDGFYPFLSEIGNDHFSIRIMDKAEKKCF